MDRGTGEGGAKVGREGRSGSSGGKMNRDGPGVHRPGGLSAHENRCQDKRPGQPGGPGDQEDKELKQILPKEDVLPEQVRRALLCSKPLQSGKQDNIPASAARPPAVPAAFRLSEHHPNHPPIHQEIAFRVSRRERGPWPSSYPTFSARSPTSSVSLTRTAFSSIPR
jgi:hypothetical protein